MVKSTFHQRAYYTRLIDSCSFLILTLYSIDTHSDTSKQQRAFENIEGKEEIARNVQFLLFPTMFSIQSCNCIPIFHIFDIITLFAAKLEEPKIGISGKGLISQTGYLIGSFLDKNNQTFSE